MTNTDLPMGDDSQTIKEILALASTNLCIDGIEKPASNGATFEVENPATGTVIATVASATAEDAAAALDAACNAQQAWAETPARQRADILLRTFNLIHEHADQLAALMTLEMGKPLSESYTEVTYGAEFFRWFAEQAAHLDGHYTDSPEGKLRILVSHRPIGPTYLVTPWNFPLAMATRKLAPALAAGCTAVLKPSEVTPLTSLRLGQLLREAGLPDGVVNIIPSLDAPTVSDTIMQDPRTRKISFTGSTQVGRHLLRAAADNVLRISMELGGNAPFIVLEDADLDAAVQGAVDAKMRNMGEACTAANRFLVHESLAAEFGEQLAARFKELKCANGLDPESTCGPLISKDARERVAALVDDAVESGAKVLCGGKVVEGPGYFYEPTVLTDVPTDARVYREEIFGPVAPITTFRTVEETLEMANSTEYGLASYLYTQNMALALDFNDRLEAGMMGLNVGVISNAAAPFGGLKQSGMGREGGAEGIHDYMDTRYIGMPRGTSF